jgi:hypothetical protein
MPNCRAANAPSHPYGSPLSGLEANPAKCRSEPGVRPPAPKNSTTIAMNAMPVMTKFTDSVASTPR